VFRASNNPVKKLLRTTRNMSLKEMPAIKAMPPALPLLRLCLITVKTMGPTEIASNNPSVTPLINESTMRRLKIMEKLLDERVSVIESLGAGLDGMIVVPWLYLLQEFIPLFQDLTF
jgi:hypothetical protein